MASKTPTSVAIIGGGFYGVVIALYLRQSRRMESVVLYEMEGALLSRASYANQARVHGGYHYPRSYTTAFRSRQNLSRFCFDWNNCIKTDFVKYYALARRNSKVSSLQFERFCDQVGAPLEQADDGVLKLFNSALIENAYRVEEYAFDALKLRAWANIALKRADIKIFLNHKVLKAAKDQDAGIEVISSTDSQGIIRRSHKYVFNCTYSGLTQVSRDTTDLTLNLKHEITELALIKPPQELEGFGVTVMDGPFFSTMPFPAKNCHSLSHVRYTPHSQWIDKSDKNPYENLRNQALSTRVDRMLRDSSRYLPVLAKSIYQESLFEVKSVLVKNEVDDGRPILFSESRETPGLFSILGGKIDNIYDILESIEKLPLLGSEA